MKSIRHELVTKLLLGLVVLYGFSALVLCFYTSAALRRQFDTDLLNWTRAFAQASNSYQDTSHASYYQIRNQQGKTIAKSSNLHQMELPVVSAGHSPEYSNVSLPGDKQGRAVSITFSTKANTKLNITMARSREDVDNVINILLFCVVLSAMSFPLGTAIVVRCVKRGLEPLEEISSRTALIDASSLAQRFKTKGIHAELVPICERLNDLLERIDKSLKRERRFTSDVSHELRTPIAELRSLAEVGLMLDPDNKDDNPKPYFKDAMDIADQMDHLIGTLLSIVRCDTGDQIVKNEIIDLVELVKEAWHPHEDTAKKGGVTYCSKTPPSAQVCGDRFLIFAVLTNLYSNAAGYSPSGGKIKTSIKEKKQTIYLTVANTNEQLSKEDLAFLTEPFWQKDAARSDTFHAGIGLSLVRAYTELMNMPMEIELKSTDVFQITLKMPLADANG